MATIPGVSDGELIRTTWGDAVADELNNVCVKKTGSTMTGSLTMSSGATVGGVPTPTASGHAAPKTYVDTQDALRLPLTGGTISSDLVVNATPFVDGNQGLMLRGDTVPGQIANQVRVAGDTNLILCRTGTSAVATAERFIAFQRGLGTLIGSVSIASASSVAYNTTSDPRLKEPTGDVADAADLVHELGAKAYRGRWIADQGDGDEWVFLNSTDVEAVAPYAVAGEAGATDGGEIVPQQVNYPSLVPVLFAALSQALDRIAALEAAAT